ncbi:MAG: T9SS type A sorting domain-containing protein [Phycisphaerae bacterium]|nr:T9SS type A sorting domain-containing protein [Saprospiraceae bacterium]
MSKPCPFFTFLPLLLLFFFASPIPAQILENHFFGNTLGADLLPEHLIALDDGGAVITGRTNTLDTGGYHVLLIRTDSLGNVLWQRTYHQGGGAWVAKALDGGFIVGGSSNRHLFGSQQGFVLKVNESGVEEWKQYLPDGDHSYVSGVEQLSSGNIAVCGIVVNESLSISQKVFWAIFSASGILNEYQTIDHIGTSYSPKIIEAKNGNLILGWSAFGDDMLRCFNPDGQTIWEQNLNSEFAYEFGGKKSLLVDSIGDVWIAGGYQFSLNHYIPQVLHLSADGDLKHRFSHEPFNFGPTALYPGQNGKVNFWFPKYYGNNKSGLVKLVLSNQGTVLAKDSVLFDYYPYQAIASIHENRLLLLHSTNYFYQNPRVTILPIQKSGADYLAQDLWVFSSGLPYSHEYYEAHCSSRSGGAFTLTRGQSRSTEFNTLGYYALKTNEADQETTWTYLGEGNNQAGGQIQPAADGGALAMSYYGQIWKVDANANLLWSKTASRGKLVAGPNNDFFIVESKTQPSPYEPILIHHYDQNGDSIAVKEVYSSSLPYGLMGAVGQIDNGPVLFGYKYSNSDSLWHNWIIYLDKSGEFVSETLLSDEYALFTYETKIIRSSDGGAVVASFHNENQGIYMMHLKDGEVLWDYNLLSSDPDSISNNLISIEEVPCKGYVVAFETNTRSTNTQSTRLMILHHIDEHGQGKDFYAYKPLLGLVQPDSSFLPGYTFRRWGQQLNGQTYDILLQTVHFQDTNSIAIPTGHLAISPNPSGDETCLHYKSDSYGLLEIEVFNEAGQRMDRFKSEKTASDWEFHYRAHYPIGIYFIQIKNGEKERVVQRWVKVR